MYTNSFNFFVFKLKINKVADHSLIVFSTFTRHILNVVFSCKGPILVMLQKVVALLKPTFMLQYAQIM